MSVRNASPADVDAVLDLQHAWQREVYGEPRTDRAVLAAHWPDYGHWVADAGGRLDGYASVSGHGGIEVWVRPGAEGAGVGEALLARIEESHAGPLEAIVPAAAVSTLALLEPAGFARVREVLEMAADLPSEPEAAKWPAGVEPRPYDDARDARTVHDCLVEAFAGSDERVAPFDEWHPWLLGDPSYDPAVVFVAESDGNMAGVAQCWVEGFVKDLAVRPRYRGRGIGEALLRHAFRAFYRRGVRRVSLKVDATNATGAVRLYHRVGMREVRRYVLCRRA